VPIVFHATCWRYIGLINGPSRGGEMAADGGCTVECFGLPSQVCDSQFDHASSVTYFVFGVGICV